MEALFGYHPERAFVWLDAQQLALATSFNDIWRGNLWWAKRLLGTAIAFRFLEVLGVIQEVGLVALNLTVIAFLFSMGGTLGEVSSTLNQVESTLDRIWTRSAGRRALTFESASRQR